MVFRVFALGPTPSDKRLDYHMQPPRVAGDLELLTECCLLPFCSYCDLAQYDSPPCTVVPQGPLRTVR